MRVERYDLRKEKTVIRRQFLERVAKAGAAGLVALEAGCSREQKTVTFMVRGFTCITCATGLETLLGRERGVISVVASYAQGKACVVFDPSRTTVQAMESSMREMGFQPAIVAG